jgi:hypothetical protein
MKRFAKTVVLAGILGVTAGVAAANAQVTEPMRFKTTFPFTVGNKTFPAGSYTVRPLEGAMDVMEISNGSSTVFFNVNPTGTRHEPVKDEVVFTKHGNEYALQTIWDAADLAGVSTVPARNGSHEHQAR